MKNLIRQLMTLLTLFVSGALLAAADMPNMDNVQVLVRIHSIKDAQAATGYAIELDNQSLGDVLKSLKPNDEVILSGSIKYHPVTRDNHTELNPTFIIKSIRPISLERIGKIETRIDEPPMLFATLDFVPKSISISENVASAMTMTASVLLLKDLAAAHQSQSNSMQNKVNTGVLFSAGALATGLFVWEQLQKK